MPALSHPTWTGTRVSFAGTSARAAAYEWPLLQAAVVPSIALAAGGIGLVATRTAYWIAIGYGAVMLVWWGLVIARREGLGLAATCAVVVVNASFALFIVALKLLVGHERSSVRRPT